jgi:hypothetical protein
MNTMPSCLLVKFGILPQYMLDRTVEVFSVRMPFLLNDDTLLVLSCMYSIEELSRKPNGAPFSLPEYGARKNYNPERPQRYD